MAIILEEDYDYSSTYCVSLVYESPTSALLRSLVTKANSSEEALGKAIFYFDSETKGYNLKMKCVIRVSEENLIK